MEINRNQWFMFGIVLLFIGLQLKLVDSFVLNDRVSQKIAERTSQASESSNPFPTFLTTVAPVPRKVISPPDWLGFAVLSIGAVVVFDDVGAAAAGDGVVAGAARQHHGVG